MNGKIIVNGAEITVTTIDDKDYISLTDMLKAKDGDFFISDWLRNRNTVEFLGIWEQIHNPDFNYGEFATIRSQAGLNSYKLSVKEWVEKTKATPRNDMKKPHHLPISANCGGGSAYFRCMGKLNQAGKQRLSARIRFASANNIFNFAVCFRRPRYRVFRYRNRPFTTPKTCSTFARTDDFSCSLRFN